MSWRQEQDQQHRYCWWGERWGTNRASFIVVTRTQSLATRDIGRSHYQVHAWGECQPRWKDTNFIAEPQQRHVKPSLKERWDIRGKEGEERTYQIEKHPRVGTLHWALVVADDLVHASICIQNTGKVWTRSWVQRVKMEGGRKEREGKGKREKGRGIKGVHTASAMTAPVFPIPS